MADLYNNKEQKQELLPFDNVKYRKSNKLVNSRGRSSASVHKLFTVAISEAKFNGENNCAEAIISGTKLRKIFNNFTGSFYESVKNACMSDKKKPDLLSWRLGMEDAESETFKYVNVVTSAEFTNGTLRVVFSPEVTKELTGLKNNYSEFYRAVTLQMKSSYSMMLYEKLSSQADYLRSTTKNQNGPYVIVYSLKELRLALGVDTEPLGGKKDDKKPRMYSRFQDFKLRVLDVAVDETNEISPLYVEYNIIKAGRGAKAEAIEFIVTRKKKESVEPISKDEELRRKIAFADATSLLAGEDIGIREVQSICREADYDYSKIEHAYELSKKQDLITNFTGWMIAALRNDYQDTSSPEKEEKKKTAKKASGTKTKKTGAKHFEYERQYTDQEWAEMENMLNNCWVDSSDYEERE